MGHPVPLNPSQAEAPGLARGIAVVSETQNRSSGRNQGGPKCLILLVGAIGFEPTTLCSQSNQDMERLPRPSASNRRPTLGTEKLRECAFVKSRHKMNQMQYVPIFSVRPISQSAFNQ